jgi:hypothetical protein
LTRHILPEVLTGYPDPSTLQGGGRQFGGLGSLFATIPNFFGGIQFGFSAFPSILGNANASFSFNASL